MLKSGSIHITLKFLGEIEPEICTRDKNALTEISNIAEPFKINISESGTFPNFNKPRVFWFGLLQDKNQSLNCLNEWIEGKLTELGFAPEKRKFSPHLTLGRIRNPANYNQLIRFFMDKKFEQKTINVNQIVLMKSELRPAGAVYTPIQIYKL